MQDSGEENKSDLSFTRSNQSDKLKDNVLDENFKKAVFSMKNNKSSNQKKGKKPFFKIGIVLFLVSIICLGIILKLPWMYIKYNPSSSNLDQYENFYYINFYGGDQVNNTVVTFFESGDSKTYIGIDSYDFSFVPKLSIYIFGIIALIGLVFTILILIDRRKDFINFEKLYIIHTFFMIITIILSTFLVYLSIRFLGAILLSVINNNLLEAFFPNLIAVYPAPLFLIFISASLMKLSATLIKSNFEEIINIKEERDKNKLKIKRS